MNTKRTTWRFWLSLVILLVLVPLTVLVFSRFDRKYYLAGLAIIVLTTAAFFLHFESRKPQARELVVIAVLCALGVAGRAAFFMLPQFKPVMALTIIAGVAFGGETGFLVGAMTMLASNFLFSQGPWTPFQMFSMGIIGFLAGGLFRKGWPRRAVRVRCHRRCGDLRRHHEPGLGADVQPGGAVEGAGDVLHHRLPHGLRPRRSHSFLPAGAGGAHAGEAGPHQDQIRLSGISRCAHPDGVGASARCNFRFPTFFSAATQD